MTCVEWEIWISAYHDDALDAERRRAVEVHLAGCALCRAYSESMATIGPMLQAAMTRAEAPETLFARVMTQLPEPSAKGPRWKPVLRPPRGWLSFGLAPVGIALWLLMAGPSTPKLQTDRSMAAAPQGGSAKSRVDKTAATRNSGNGRGKGANPPGPKNSPAGGPRRTAPIPKGSPSKASPTPPADPRPELEPLRRMQQRRPPRFQDRLVRRSGLRLVSNDSGERRRLSPRRSHRRYRYRPQRRTRPTLIAKHTPITEPQIQNPPPPVSKPEAWVTVVDYVLPQAAPETTVGEGTEFVLRAAETYEVTPTSYEY